MNERLKKAFSDWRQADLAIYDLVKYHEDGRSLPGDAEKLREATSKWAAAMLVITASLDSDAGDESVALETQSCGSK